MTHPQSPETRNLDPIESRTPRAPRSGGIETSRRARALWFPVKLLIGMVLSQSLLTSILIVGWTYRLMQRTVLKSWWSMSGQTNASKTSFPEFLASGTWTRRHERWPNWFLRSRALRPARVDSDRSVSNRIAAAFRVLTASLWANARTGVQGIMNTWVLTLPACVLWVVFWYDGWNNSFNKGYEQAAVGPLGFLFGMALFIAAMYYLPLAQARQAMTGRWRSFYDFRVVWKIVKQRWFACLGLAVLYSLLAWPANILKSAPEFFPQINPELEGVSRERMISILNTYFFWCALYVFPAFVLLRLVAARIYASGIVKALQRGSITEEDLTDHEWDALQRLELIKTAQPRPRRFLVRFLAWSGSRAGRVTTGVLLAFLWFTFVAQIVIAQFFHFHPRSGWLNQPLVQLPWFHFVPREHAERRSGGTPDQDAASPI